MIRRSCILDGDNKIYVDEICALLGYYAASCDDCLPTFRENVSIIYVFRKD
jgi:hypothetical protein